MAILAPKTLAIDQGADKTWPIYFFSPDPLGSGDLSLAAPLNLSGKNARLMIRVAQDYSSALILSLLNTGASPGLVFATGTSPGLPALATILNPNGIKITITKAQSLVMLASQTGYYDMFFDDIASGISDLYMQGPFLVNATVTR